MEKERISYPQLQKCTFQSEGTLYCGGVGGLCNLCGGDMKRSVNRNVQLPLKSRSKGGAVFSDAFEQGTMRASQIMD